MSKHTQGTWITGYGYVDGIGEVFGVGIQTEPDWTPICILSPTEKVNETDLANADLIAAAPELLEQLEYMTGQHRCGCGHPHCNRCEDDRMNQEIINKVKGKK